ncbi:MAG: LysR family transcriptional regulator [Sulfitobacter sp.]
MNVSNTPDPISDSSPVSGQGLPHAPALLYEMMRSFTTLARTLNLSHAVEELKSTRQTVRRHIAQLEEMSNDKLFLVQDRHYHLTQHGAEMLPEADELLSRGRLWAAGKSRHVNDLMGFSHEEPNGWSFYQQQQPLSHMWTNTCRLLPEVMTRWCQCNGQLEHDDFQSVRPYVLVYRDTPHGWLCVEIGEESFYSQWWGWKNARSSVGRNLGEFPGGREFESLLNQAFHEVKANGGVRLDEVVTQIPREEGGAPVPLAYQRLLLGGEFPDGSLALIAVVDRVQEIRIAGLDQSVLDDMPPDATSKFVSKNKA